MTDNKPEFLHSVVIPFIPSNKTQSKPRRPSTTSSPPSNTAATALKTSTQPSVSSSSSSKDKKRETPSTPSAATTTHTPTLTLISRKSAVKASVRAKTISPITTTAKTAALAPTAAATHTNITATVVTIPKGKQPSIKSIQYRPDLNRGRWLLDCVEIPVIMLGTRNPNKRKANAKEKEKEKQGSTVIKSAKKEQDESEISRATSRPISTSIFSRTKPIITNTKAKSVAAPPLSTRVLSSSSSSPSSPRKSRTTTVAHTASPIIKSRVKGIFGDDDDNGDDGHEGVCTKKVGDNYDDNDVGPASMDKLAQSQQRKHQDRLLFDIFGDDDDVTTTSSLVSKGLARGVATTTRKTAKKRPEQEWRPLRQERLQFRSQEPLLSLSKRSSSTKTTPSKKTVEQKAKPPSTRIRLTRRVLTTPTPSASEVSSPGTSEDEGNLGTRSLSMTAKPRLRAFKQNEGSNLDSTESMAEAHQRIVPFKQMTSKRTVMADEDDKDEDDLPVRRRRMPAKRRLPRRFSSSEDEVRAELKNLKKVRTNLPKRRERPQKNQFARNLEKLKRARLGLSPIQSSDSSSAGDSDRGGDDEDEDGDDGKLEDTIQNSSDQDDTSFIVEDPEDDEDDLNQIPDEFRLSTHQNLETDFKVYVQYLLNLSFDQDFERNHANDKYFRHSINHVIRTLGSYQTSMTVSQKWSHDFKRQLDSRPHYSKRRSSGLMRPCDACQISNRPATFVGILSGAKYNMPKSLRDMSYFDEDLEESTSDEEEGEEEEDNDKSFKFYLGKYCCQRSFVYHQLRHWNFHCATKIEQEAEEIQERERSKQKTKHQSSLDIDTNFLQDKLEASGFVDQLWKQLKAILTGARDLESSKDF